MPYHFQQQRGIFNRARFLVTLIYQKKNILTIFEFSSSSVLSCCSVVTVRRSITVKLFFFVGYKTYDLSACAVPPPLAAKVQKRLPRVPDRVRVTVAYLDRGSRYLRGDSILFFFIEKFIFSPPAGRRISANPRSTTIVVTKQPRTLYTNNYYNYSVIYTGR